MDLCFQGFWPKSIGLLCPLRIDCKTILLINIGEQNLYAWSYTSIFQPIFGDYFGSLMFALSFVMIIWVIAWIMDRKGIIVKV